MAALYVWVHAELQGETRMRLAVFGIIIVRVSWISSRTDRITGPRPKTKEHGPLSPSASAVTCVRFFFCTARKRRRDRTTRLTRGIRSGGDAREPKEGG